MNILVTGGLGFIGAHTCVALLDAGHCVVVADNLVNSKISVVDGIKRITGKRILFYDVDATNQSSINSIFSNSVIDGVIHFAGLKAVAESIEKPMQYYYNNLASTLVLCEACLQFGVNRFVFSSSATVYGDNDVPFVETMELRPTTNPYGETKVMNEKILRDIAKAHPNFAISLLRYFNPIGAHESGLIGENPNGVPNNLMPYITRVARGELDMLHIFGGDYETPDGTAIRDYIHVMDIAEGHIAALENLRPGVALYNLGSGKGTSVLELVHAFQDVNNIRIPYEITERRSGDIAVCYADVSKAKRELNWCAKRDIYDMCRDAWRFESGDRHHHN